MSLVKLFLQVLIASWTFEHGSNSVSRPNGVKTFDSKLAAANDQFALDLLKTILATKAGDKNVIFSPFNIVQVLSVILLGSRADTFSQLARGLHYNETVIKGLTEGNQDLIHKTLADVTRALIAAPNVTLEISNALYSDKNFLANPTFTQSLANIYKSVLYKNLDLAHDSRNSEMAINKDISKATKGKIENLLPTGSLGEDTKMVVTSAIYFKGDWKDKFDDNNSVIEPFYLDDGKVIDTLMMKDFRKVHYGRFELPSEYVDSPTMKHPQLVETLRLDYANENLAMYIILPERNGLKFLVEDLSWELLQSLTKMYPQKTYITLPVFKVDYELELKETLMKLNINDLFDATKADLRKMAANQELLKNSSQRLCLNNVYHKAQIEVNEKGSQASAATGAVISAKAIFLPQNFTANRPFLYFIADRRDLNILFMGTFITPPSPLP
ncbi:unnamed protein product [Gordionus sp. m RMFG-2023]